MVDAPSLFKWLINVSTLARRCRYGWGRSSHCLQFLVDAGASSVAVTDAFAKRAGLTGGQPTTFMTANGPRPGRMLRDVPVLAGNMAAARVDVGTGLFAQAADEALLGQSFLAQFDVILRKDHMVIKQRGRLGVATCARERWVSLNAGR